MPPKGAEIPAWYGDAMRREPEVGRLQVEGAGIEWAAWGERSKPGLLLLIGNGAQIGWWRPIAPILAEDYRVATFAWSGMGRSDWRDSYPVATLICEAVGVAQVAGLFDGPQAPYLGAHSFGGFVGLRLLIEHGARFAGGILIDSRLRSRQAWGANAQTVSPFHVHETKEQAIVRFRLKPEQPEVNRFILDMLAEESLEPVGDGWRYRQDPNMRSKTPLDGDLIPRIAETGCPLAFIRGARSGSVVDEIWHAQKAAAPAGTPFVEIPDAHHHLMIDQPLALIAAMRALLQCFPRSGTWNP
jgi:pimeloyl-ACP methyl ester carboxylesterase